MIQRRSYLLVFVFIIAGLAGLMGCAQKQPDLSFKEMTNPDCYFVKEKTTAAPSELLKSYLDRDAAGDLTVVNGWFDSAVLCPGHEAGPAVSYVIKSSRILSVEVGVGSASARVEYEVIGFVDPGAQQSWHFKKKKETKTRTFKFAHTAYGWRFNNSHLADGEYLSVTQAKARVSDEK
jgi:hypothetical protein